METTTKVFIRPQGANFIIQRFNQKVYLKRGETKGVPSWTSNIAKATTFTSAIDSSNAATDEFKLELIPTASVIPVKGGFVIQDNCTGYYRAVISIGSGMGLTKEIKNAHKYDTKEEAVAEAKKWIVVGIHYVE